MPFPGLTVEQVIELVQQLSVEGKKTVLAALQSELAADLKMAEEIADEMTLDNSLKLKPSSDIETEEWLEADLSGEMPSYEWGDAGEPQGKPVKYIPGKGLVVEGGQDFVECP